MWNHECMDRVEEEYAQTCTDHEAPKEAYDTAPMVVAAADEF